MPTEPKKPIIVISYAHADEPENPAADEVKWLSFVTGYLRPAIKQGAVDLWIDRLMPGGADWEREIGEKLRACDIFILLVSRHSLSSDYVVDKEIALIRERQAKGEAVHFYPLVLTPTPKIALELVRDKNLRPRDGKPFSEYPLHERERHMSEAADEIEGVARDIAGRRSAAPLPAEAPSAAPRSRPANEAPHSAPPKQPEKRSSTASALSFATSWFRDRFSGSRDQGPWPRPAIEDRVSLVKWLSSQDREVAVAIASRVALRVAPFGAATALRDREVSARLTSALFRASALARAAA